MVSGLRVSKGLDRIVRHAYKCPMDAQQNQFEYMLEALMQFVDAVNERHAGGVSFGSNHSLYPAEIHTIVAIGNNPGIGLTKLAEKLSIAKPTLSERIRKLVDKGFVVKDKDSTDQKAMMLRLTEEGKKAEKHHETHHLKMYEVFRKYFADDTAVKINLFTNTFRELAKFEEEAAKKA